MPTDAEIAALVRKVSSTNIKRDVKHLSTAYPTRHTLGKYLLPCSEWLSLRLKQSGLRNVGFHEYTQSGKRLRNVVAEKATSLSGWTKPPKTVIVCAHFDSRMERLNDSEARAPGANDNATGVAVLLEAARILSPIALPDTLRFILFSGEEQGLWGSAAYVQNLPGVGPGSIRFVFNIDQIGYPPPNRAIFVDRDEGNAHRDNDAASASLVQQIQTLARRVVKVPTDVDPAYGSDYIPFEQKGYAIVGLYEAGKDYPHYHKTTDTFEQVDFTYVTDMARLTVASLFALARNPS